MCITSICWGLVEVHEYRRIFEDDAACNAQRKDISKDMEPKHTSPVNLSKTDILMSCRFFLWKIVLTTCWRIKILVVERSTRKWTKKTKTRTREINIFIFGQEAFDFTKSMTLHIYIYIGYVQILLYGKRTPYTTCVNFVVCKQATFHLAFKKSKT